MKKRISSVIIVICLVIQMITIIGVHGAGLTLIYKASEGFSDTQGKNNWSYNYRLSSDQVITTVQSYANNRWQTSNTSDNCFTT